MGLAAGSEGLLPIGDSPHPTFLLYPQSFLPILLKVTHLKERVVNISGLRMGYMIAVFFLRVWEFLLIEVG